MTETYWNGLPTPAERCRVVVDTSPVHTWWCADLAGTERAAVRVGEPGGEVIYLDDEDGSGWWKVTEGRGSPREAYWSLPVVREVPSTPESTSADDVLHEVITRIDLTRSGNEHTVSPWANSDVLELLGYLREPYTDAAPQPPTHEQIAEVIEQDERVQTWHTIWAYVCVHRPQPIEDKRTAEQYVLALLTEGASR